MESYIFLGYGKRKETNRLKKVVSAKKEISVIIPAYNEAGNIEKIVKAVEENLKKTNFGKSYEIIVVEDNSKDKTGEIIDKLAKKENFIALHRYGKKGLFSAVSDGILISNGKYILTLDADFSHPPELIPKMVKYAQKYDAVIASRYIKGGSMRAPFIRIYGSKILNWMCIFVAGLDVSDFGGQFRLFNKSKYEQIKFNTESRFAEYGIELFYRAKKLGFSVKEIPFVYKFREEGTSKMGNMFKLPVLGFSYLRTAFKLRFENLI